MATMRFEQVQRFILAKKYFEVRGTSSSSEGKFSDLSFATK